MDPETQREFEEQLRQMTEMLSQTNSTMAGMVSSIKNQTSAITNNINSVKNQTAATSQLTNSTSTQSKLSEAEAKATELTTKAKQGYTGAIRESWAALKTFGAALTSTEEGFKKYGSAVESAGAAIQSIGSNFGLVGNILGGVVRGLTFFASEALAMHDTMIQLNRDFTKFAGVMPGTVRDVANLAAEAGYAGERMGQLVKFTQGLNQNIVALGETAGQGTLSFIKIANVGEEVYQHYSKMGIAQEQLTEMQTYYLREQAQSGRALALRTKSEEQLRKESLAYVENMTLLSAMTGQQAEDMQREREVVKSEFEERVKVRQEELAAQAAEARGDQEEADRIRAQAASRRSIIDTYTTMYGQEVGSMIGRVLRQGGFDEFTGGLAAAGIQVEELTGQMNIATQEQLMAQRRGASAEEIANIRLERSMQAAEPYRRAQDEFATNFGDAAQYAKGLGESFGQTTEALGRGENTIGRTVREQYEAATAERRREEQEAAANRDRDAAMRSEQETADRNFQRQYQEAMLNLANTIIPAITTAVEAATAALATFNDNISMVTGWLNTLKEHLGTVVAVLGTLVGVSVLGNVISVFRLLGGSATGLARIFSGLRGVFSSAINWIRGLLGMAPAAGGGGAAAAGAAGGGGAAAAGAAGGGRLMRLARGAMGGLGGLLGGLALDYGADRAAEAGYTRTSAGLSAGSSALTGAGLGATVGSIIPGVGTVVGGAVGGLLGGAYGLYQNWGRLTGSPEEQQQQERIRTEQEDNTRRQTDNTTRNERIAETNATSSVRTSRLTELQARLVQSQARTIQAFARSVLAFTLSIRSFDTIIKDLKEKLDSMIGMGSTNFGGDVDRILATIRQRESGNNYQAQAAGSSASGAYQFIDSTWRTLTRRFNIGTEYQSAKDAPAAIQDQVAAAYVRDILERAGGDVSKVPLEWYTGNIEGRMSSSAIAANNGLTPEAYQQRWMQDYSRMPGTSSSGSSLVELGRRLQSQGLTISGHSAFNPGGRMTTSGHASNSRHYRDQAIDINAPGGIVEADHPEWGPRFDRIAAELQAAGYSVLWRTQGHDNHIHASIGPQEGSRVRAARGGVFDGPSSGYPAELHGSEMVAPLDTNSILMKLATTPADSQTSNSVIDPIKTIERETVERLVSVNSDMVDILTRKLDDVINAIGDGNDTRNKIFKNTMV